MASERPWLFVEAISENAEEWRAGRDRFRWKFRISNNGRMPAIINNVTALAMIGDSSVTGGPVTELAPQITTSEDVRNARYTILSAGDETSEFSVEYGVGPIQDKNREGTQRTSNIWYTNSAYFRDDPNMGILGSVGFWLKVYVAYEAPSGSDHVTSACFVRVTYGALTEIKVTGGQAYNQRT